MDRSWINCKRTSEEYERGVEQFIEFATRNVPDNNGRFYCPCVNCLNERRLPIAVIREHVLCDGIPKSYTKWTWHGEIVEVPITHVSETEVEEVDFVMEDGLDDAELPLYSGCIKYTRLSAILKLFNVKARNGWRDKSFTELLELVSDILPEGNTMPTSNYDAKKILCPMGMEYKKIHACPNDCVLYRNEYEKLHQCPHCGLSRYKQKDAKVLWYLPIIPRFKRLFANVKDAKLVRWHADERKRDGQIRHPADCSQWQTIDSMFPYFGNDPRNLRLALATDGMNPYSNLSSRHSTWPVMLVIYNLPPWLCMKRKYIMLSLMVSGPRQLGNDIDVYLSPLVEDLKMLWEEGVDVFDGYTSSTFKLHAMLFCTINDFPAYGNLSGRHMSPSTKAWKETPDDQSDLISPPPRHDKWKRARTKPSGEYTSEETRLIAERIDDLVEKISKGSFTQQGREDILATAIGSPEHPGYVRGVGGGVGIKQFFSGTTRKVTLAQLSESDKNALRNEFKKELFPQLRDELLSEIKSEIASLGLAVQGPPKETPPIVASTKGSCPLHEESGDGVDVPVDCELYIDDPPGIWWP
ncbi:hypothetical protein V8G54_000424 [Vigna mungo]|uniref:Transposase-associated domain-containing protein n=1 Tax=Vigna mungo TaxID=3915 RepID=A0AAQ3P6H0_VIGMU